MGPIVLGSAVFLPKPRRELVHFVLMTVRRGLGAWIGVLLMAGGPLVAQVDNTVVDLLRGSISEYKAVIGGDGMLDPCVVHSFFGSEGVHPSVPAGLEEYAYVWNQPCPFARAVGVRPTKFDVIEVVVDGDSAVVHLVRNNGHNEDPYSFVFRRASDGEWTLDRIYVKPSMDRGLGRDAEMAQLPGCTETVMT
jgi:hypothetical protein